jgi:hypothetical protein
MMSNTCSQLHMCNMYNTLMKYAHKQGKKKPKNHVSHFFTTICARCITIVPLSFQHLLEEFHLFIYLFILSLWQ